MNSPPPFDELMVKSSLSSLLSSLLLSLFVTFVIGTIFILVIVYTRFRGDINEHYQEGLTLALLTTTLEISRLRVKCRFLSFSSSSSLCPGRPLAGWLGLGWIVRWLNESQRTSSKKKGYLPKSKPP